jgi:aminoglycoside phosphotransferase (APT) family kinase protein
LNLPDFPTLDDAALEVIGSRFGVRLSDIAQLPQVGIFNAIFALGDDLILRVPRAHHAFTEAIHKEAQVVPLARALGLSTPELVALDDTCDVLSVPFGVWRRVHGRTLGLLDLEPDAVPDVWRAVGRDLARLHAGIGAHGVLAGFELEALPDAVALADRLEGIGVYGRSEARWLRSWLERLSAQGGSAPRCFLHGDLQTTNIMVSDVLEYRALLDWGACGWGDPAWDFAGVPLGVVPMMLEGYREVWSTDAGMEARILHRHLQMALFLMTRAGQPHKSWAERPLGVMLAVLRFLQDAPEPWRGLRLA